MIQDTGCSEAALTSVGRKLLACGAVMIRILSPPATLVCGEQRVGVYSYINTQTMSSYGLYCCITWTETAVVAILEKQPSFLLFLLFPLTSFLTAYPPFYFFSASKMCPKGGKLFLLSFFLFWSLIQCLCLLLSCSRCILFLETSSFLYVKYTFD